MVLVGVTTVLELELLTGPEAGPGVEQLMGVMGVMGRLGFGWMLGGVDRGVVWVKGVARGRWRRLVRVGDPAPVMDSILGEKQELSSPGPSKVRGRPRFLFISPILSSPLGDIMF